MLQAVCATLRSAVSSNFTSAPHPSKPNLHPATRDITVLSNPHSGVARESSGRGGPLTYYYLYL